MTDRRPWTSGEIAQLRKLAHLGPIALADQLGRSVGSIKMQASRQRISLRRPGERRGCVLGERHPGQLHTEVRTLVFVGTSDPERAERRALSTDPLCPDCGHRPQERRSGLCEVCYLRRLTWSHRQEAAIASARRELDAARQAKHRARESR